MGKHRRSNRDQIRDRQEAALEKKWREEVQQRKHTRGKKREADIAKELATDIAEEQRYEQGLADAYGDVADDELYRKIRDIEEELLRTTTEARDLIELLHELRDEIYRRNGRL